MDNRIREIASAITLQVRLNHHLPYLFYWIFDFSTLNYLQTTTTLWLVLEANQI